MDPGTFLPPLVTRTVFQKYLRKLFECSDNNNHLTLKLYTFTLLSTYSLSKWKMFSFFLMPAALLELGMPQPFLSFSHWLNTFRDGCSSGGRWKLSVSTGAVVVLMNLAKLFRHPAIKTTRGISRSQSTSNSNSAATSCWEISILSVVSLL